MRISDLRECVILAQTHSFTRTAQLLYTTQSAVSKHISSIERDLGCQLFTRTNQDVCTTGYGDVFVAYANRIVGEYNEAITSINAMKEGIETTLEIGYLAGAVSNTLPDAISAFSKEHPEVELRCRAMEVDGIINEMDSSKLDIAILMDYVKLPSVYASHPLYGDELCVIVPKGHRLSGRKSVNLKDLQGESILTANPHFMIRESPLIQNLLVSIHLDVSLNEIANDVLGLFMLMETGRYITIFFRHIENYSDFSDKFDFIPLEEASDQFDVVAAWRKTSENTAIRDFIRCLDESIKNKSK